jgi:hypothetical protein
MTYIYKPYRYTAYPQLLSVWKDLLTLAILGEIEKGKKKDICELVDVNQRQIKNWSQTKDQRCRCDYFLVESNRTLSNSTVRCQLYGYLK